VVSAPIEDAARQILSQVPDPEIPVVSIEELGILRGVALEGSTLHITLTPTYSGCPAIDQICADVQTALAQDARTAHLTAQVCLQLAPAWTTDWMTDATRQKLRTYGVAPPHTRATGDSTQIIQFATKKAANYPANTGAMGVLNTWPAVPCPQCGSHDTTETSHFGSTACKALYRCLACLEPFDYFKPY
jgi:ring-1,2-phenylacetyl-CoA epoxidase subunit PaaD